MLLLKIWLDVGHDQSQPIEYFIEFSIEAGPTVRPPNVLEHLVKRPSGAIGLLRLSGRALDTHPNPNPIESSFATIRHRTTRTKNCVSRNKLLGLVFQLALAAERIWRKLGGFKLLPDVARGVRFQDGIAVVDPPDQTEDDQQKIAA